MTILKKLDRIGKLDRTKKIWLNWTKLKKSDKNENIVKNWTKMTIWKELDKIENNEAKDNIEQIGQNVT